MGFLVLNNARTTLSGAVSIGDTSLPVADGSLFAVGTDYSYITIENNAGQIEVVKLTARSGGTLTIAAPGTVYAWASGSIVECRPCSQAVAAIVEDTIHDASAETTIADGDELPIVDVSASNVLKKITWANVKATLKTYLDTLYQSLTGDITLAAGKAVIFEGATDNAYETTLTAADPTADRTITLPDYTGTTQVQARGADIASAGTINLSTATGDIVDVTGTTAITAITLADGLQKHVRFTDALTLTHGTNLRIPGAADLTTATGDTATFRGYAAGLVRCVAYQRAAAAPLVAPGTSGNVLTSNGTLWTSAAPAGGITLGTPVPFNGLAVIDFTGIPAGTKRVTVNTNALSTSGTSILCLKIGYQNPPDASGYVALAMEGTTPVAAATTNFPLERAIGAAGAGRHGVAVLTLENASTNTWSLMSLSYGTNSPAIAVACGSKSLGGALDRVRITTQGGSDTFDAGEVNIMYE